MPFFKYQVEPIKISQGSIPNDEKNELECLSNLSMANLIRQIGSLGSHANKLFTDLIQDAQNLSNRTKILASRINNLKNRIENLDSENEELHIYSNNHTEFQSTNSNRLEQVLHRKTMPDVMRQLYEKADPPPDLYKFNSYR